MADPGNSPRRGGIHPAVYILVAVLAASIGIANVIPNWALVLAVPGLLLLLLVPLFWTWRTALPVTKPALVTAGEFDAGQQDSRAQSDSILEQELPPGAWPGVTMGDEYLAVRLSDLLRDLSDTQAESIFKIARWETLPAGTPMAAAGAPAACIYIIADGAVQLFGQSGLGDVTVRIAREGEAFPLAALLGAGDLVTSAKAATEVSVLAVPRAGLLDLCNGRPDIGMIIFKTTAEILADRYRSTLKRHLEGAEQAVRQSDLWANV